MEVRDYGIIFGNDEPNRKRAFELSESISQYVDGLKIEIYDLSFIKKVRKNVEIPIIADYKIAQMAFLNQATGKFEGTTSKYVKQLADAGADYVICHMFPGHLTLQEAVSTAHNIGIKILGLPRMTHQGADVTFDHPLDRNFIKNKLRFYGIKSLDDQIDTCNTFYEYFILLGEYFDVDGYIGTANFPEILKKMRKITRKPIFGTGLGRQRQDVPLKEQVDEAFSILGKKSALIFATEIYRNQNSVERAKEIKSLRDQIFFE